MARVLAAAMVIMGVTGCAKAPATPYGDGSIDGLYDMREAIITPPNCRSARAVCDGSRVRACIGDRPGDILEICQDACSLGRCTTSTCKFAEAENGTSGCRFYGVQSDNIDSDDGKNTMLILTNAGQTVAGARLQFRTPGGTWARLITKETMNDPMGETDEDQTKPWIEVPAQGGLRLTFNRPVVGPGVGLAAAYRVESDAPLFAVQVVSDDEDRSAHSSAGTVLRPAQALGFRHLAVTAPAEATENVLRTPGGRGGAAAITVIATTSATHVHVAPTAPAVVRAGGELDPALTAFDVPMDEGDVLQIFSATPGGDLTGTAIDADAPVAVFSGNVYTTYGYAVTAFNGGDMVQEQLPPTSSWGNQYVGAHLSSQAGCDPLFGAGAGMWRIVAADNDTTVELFAAPGGLIEGANLPANLKFKLQLGEARTVFSRPGEGQSPASDLLVNASKPILLAQWLDCEPGLSWGIDTRLMRDPLVVRFPPGFDHEVVIVRKRDSEVRFQGKPLPDDAFKVRFDAGFQLARLSSVDLERCSDELDGCVHTFSGSDFGITWRGMDVVCSYAVVVPPGDKCALPNVYCPP
jgi:hypothetical protein